MEETKDRLISVGVKKRIKMICNWKFEMPNAENVNAMQKCHLVYAWFL